MLCFLMFSNILSKNAIFLVRKKKHEDKSDYKTKSRMNAFYLEEMQVFFIFCHFFGMFREFSIFNKRIDKGNDMCHQEEGTIRKSCV